ncbi:MAG: ATP-binding cassette domain-containing protein [Candidatus Promineifilaceae bacterium]|nr:ATP-binding cassette domain-containing protein [Candidatus Promineifilaceae bacterium]
MTVLLRVTGISKQFGSLVALHDAHLDVFPGEVVGLAGRGGAGKTVLTRIIAGLETPESGRMYFDGQKVQWPFRAQSLGIDLVHEAPKLVSRFDVTSNIFLGHELRHTFLGKWLRIPDQQKMDVKARRLLTILGANLPSVHEKVENLTSEQRQLVAIAQSMALPARLRIVDDPSQHLSQPYQDKLLELMRSWQDEGTAVLFSSTNLDHLFAVADRIVVLREGRIVADLRSDETNREEIVAALVGTADRQQRTPVIWALDSYYRARRQAETLRHNQKLLEQDLEMRDMINRQLVDQLAHQVRALDSANLALQDAQRRLLTEREEERKHLARELHDQMIQDLLSLNYQLEAIETNIHASSMLDDEFSDVRGNIRALIADLRRICGNLRPPTIDSLGLGAALQSYIHDWSQRTGIEARLTLDDDFGRLPEAIELSLFRIIQEGLNNTWRHANASLVDVSLTHMSPRMLLVILADNGEGLRENFDLASVSNSGHYGLLGISERVALMGGRLTLRNQLDGGLRIQAEIPHPRVIHDDYDL